ncbi:hypothetical protein [Carboxylicivirga sp. N1Y90]|uniref:hypothetical protein n=1 Tax=Carboxylicivirga fragile TaxID=3417571 RepID=UPI003D3327C3|nr:hypothetical protein [Marinilabiliaceae bacterium N1Y90]
MKKVSSIIAPLILILLFSSCHKDSGEQKESNTIIGEWELIDLINSSDEDEYLDNITEFGYHVYRTMESDGEIIVESRWGLDAEEAMLILHNGIYGGDEAIEYRIMELSDNSLKLERGYTVDDEEIYVEYHFTRLR